VAVSRIDDMRVKPGGKFKLGDRDPADRLGWNTKQDAVAASAQLEQRLRELVAKLAATRAKALLLVLQGLDCAGKDGTTRAAFSQISPTSLRVATFKAPTSSELAHDFLWRVHAVLPERGQVGVFNRSHYEDVLVVRVHPEFLKGQKLPPSARSGDIWERRYRQINDWERFLVENGFPVVKVFLNLSKEEQRRRFLRRIDYPEKNWKFNAHDVEERKHWDEYQTAFSQMLSATSTEHAPWYVVPAEHKWFLRVAVAAVLLNTLVEIDPQYPTITDEARDALLASKKELEAQAPEGVEADPIAAAAAAAAAAKE
jgi:PPK2 family polyphosphate:nucleotide phosphotransferase